MNIPPLPPTTPVTVAYGVDPKAVERMLAALSLLPSVKPKRRTL